MDDIDRAQQQSELLLEKTINNARQQNRALSPTGFCHYCGETIADDQLFCDVGCRDDYTWRKKLGK